MNTDYRHPLEDLDEYQLDEIIAYDIPLTQANMQSMYARFCQNRDTQKTGKLRRSFVIKAVIAAVVVILTLAFTTAALAVSGVIDLSSILISIFNSRAAAPYVLKGDDIILKAGDGEVAIEVVSAFFDAAIDGLYIELKITDPTGVKLSDSLVFADSNNRTTLNTGMPTVTIIDKNTVVAGLFITPANNYETTFRFDTIASGLVYHDERQHTSFNISEHMGLSEPVVVPGAEFIEITGLAFDDGILKMTHRWSDPSVYGFGFAGLGIMLPDAEVIYSSFGEDFEGVLGQSEWFEVGDIDIGELTLVWGGGQFEHVMTGNWEITVFSGNVLEARELHGEFEGHGTRVILGATLVEIQIFTDYYSKGFPYDVMEADAVTILLKDETVINTRHFASWVDQTTASFSYNMGFVNPSDVVSVTFCGVTIEG